jgi:adenylate cyclase
MRDALDVFNEKQRAAGFPEFHTGVGINFGEVTVGNIGTEKKMDYPVIGDNVNLASRLEGLTKQYHQGIIISESLHDLVKDKVPCRLLDLVTVKGKTRGVKIYSVKRTLEAAEREAWQMNEAAMTAYTNRDFAKAARMFEEVGRKLPGDFPSGQLRARCLQYQKEPPPADWDGAEVMKSK